jgi:hypothetical protein
MTTRLMAGAVGIAGVIMAIGLGLYAIGSPASERERRLDERRVRALQGVAGSIDQYWTDHQRLPQSIAELTRDARLATETKDPISAQEYAYRTVTDRSYQLCAEFARQSAGAVYGALWAHPAGRHCFDLEVHERGR